MSSRTKKKPMSRRLFLRGAGTVALGLPFLETFSRFGSRAGAQPPADSFAVWLRQGNGVAQAGNGEPERYWPRETGRLTTDGLAAESDRALSELAPFADKILAVAGLRFAFPGNGCGHSGGGNQCLTAARVSETPSGAESLSMGDTRLEEVLGQVKQRHQGLRRHRLRRHRQLNSRCGRLPSYRSL